MKMRLNDRGAAMPAAVHWSSWILRVQSVFSLVGAVGLALAADTAGDWLLLVLAVVVGVAAVWSAGGIRRRDAAAHRVAIAVSTFVATVMIGDGIFNPDHLVRAVPMVFALWSLCRRPVRAWFAADEAEREMEAIRARTMQQVRRQLVADTPDLAGIHQRLGERRDGADG